MSYQTLQDPRTQAMTLDVLEQGGGEGVLAPYPLRQEADIWEEEIEKA